MRQKIFLLVLILLSILAACNSEAPESSPDDEASSGNPSGAAFNIAATNAVDFSLTPENASSRFVVESLDGNNTATFWFSDGNGKVVSIIFYNTAQPEAGAYEITPVDLSTGDVTVGALLIDGPDGKTYVIANGSVTLTVDEGQYSGSFSFSASDPLAADGDPTADVTGEFSGLSAQ